MIENLHARVQVGWKILLALRKKYMHLCKCAFVKSSTDLIPLISSYYRRLKTNNCRRPNSKKYIYFFGMDVCGWKFQLPPVATHIQTISCLRSNQSNLITNVTTFATDPLTKGKNRKGP